MKRLRESERGAAAIEFALVAPVMFAFMIGIFEVSWVIWTKQVVQRATHSTARCLSIGMTECTTDQGLKNYLIAEAANGGVHIAAVNIVSSKDVTCKGMERQNQVAVTLPFQGAARTFLPMLPTQISSTACFPDVSRLSRGED